MITKNDKAIEIEEMLFGDFRVQVWDEDFNSCLDREYFCRGYSSAFNTAICIQKDMFPELDIMFRRSGSRDLEKVAYKLT